MIDPLTCSVKLTSEEVEGRIRDISWQADAAYNAILPAKGSEPTKIKAHKKTFLEGSAELISVVGFERFLTVLRSIRDEITGDNKPGLPPILSVIVYGAQSFWAQAYTEAKLHGNMSALEEMLEPYDVDPVLLEEWVLPESIHDRVLRAYQFARKVHMAANSTEGSAAAENVLGAGIELSNTVVAILPEWEEMTLIREIQSQP